MPYWKVSYYRHMESVEHMKSLFDTSRDEGYQEGWSKGKLEGREEGLAEGKTAGRNEERIENARRFLALGLSPEQVAAGTQLPLDEVKKLMDK